MKLKNYTSDITQLIQKMKDNDPGVEKRQMEGYFLLWNKPPLDYRDINEMKDNKQFIMPQHGYAYNYTPIINKNNILMAARFKG